jgi:putative ABC transport system permease protein
MFREILRDLKYHKKNFLFLLLNLSFGIIGLVIILSFKSSLENSLKSRSKNILGSDISLNSRLEIEDTTLQKVEELLPSPFIKERSLSLNSMLGVKEQTKLVSIKTLTESFPFYGDFVLENASSTHEKKEFLSKVNRVWVGLDLKTQFDLKLGDTLKIGHGEFIIDNFIESDPTQSFQFMDVISTIYMSETSLKQAKLNQVGSTSRFSYHYKLEENVNLDKLAKSIEDALNDRSIRVLTPEKASSQVSRFLRYFSDFLGLVALVGLFLASTGIFYLFRSFVSSKRKEMAIYLSLGRPKREIQKYYLIYLSLLGFLGTIIGLGVGISLFMFANFNISSYFNFPLDFYLSPNYLVLSFSVGILGSLLLGLPLIKKSLSFGATQLFQENQGEIDLKLNFIWFLPLFCFYSLVAFIVCQSVRTTAIFMFSFLSLALLEYIFLHFFFKILVKWTECTKSLTTKHSLLYLLRNRAASMIAFMAIAQGLLLLTLVPQLHSGLGSELGMNNQESKPSLFMIDIQEEQVEEIKTYFSQQKIKILSMAPMIQAKLVRIKGDELKAEESSDIIREEEEGQRMRNRVANLSYRDGLLESESILEGKDFSGNFNPENQAEAELSIESRYAKRIGVELGDSLSFDILGMPISAKIVNIRKVRWTSFLPNFFLVFQPGVLEDAPKTFLAVTEHLDLMRSSSIQKEIFNKFPNVSVLDISKIASSLSSIFNLLSLFMLVMSFLSMAAGLFVLYSILSNQVFSRSKDTGLFKLLGAKRKVLSALMIKEFSLLTFFAAIVGSLGALIISFVFAELLFDGLWSPLIFYPVLLICLMTLLVAILSYLVSFKLFSKKTLELVAPFT